MAARATRYIRRCSPVYPAPTLVNGMPTRPWTPTSIVREDWAKPVLLADPRTSPVTLTQFRDVPHELRTRRGEDPGGDALLEVAFKVAPGFEAIEGGSLPWCSEGIEIKYGALKPAGTTFTLFEGLAESVDFDDGELVLSCIGALLQINDFVRAPGVDKASYDIGDAMVVKWDTSSGVRPSLHTDDLVVVGGPVGIDSSNRGAWEREWDYAQQLQALAITDSGLDQWTLCLSHPWQPQFAKRSTRGATFTISYGAPGLRFSRDWSQLVRVIYGYGSSTAGEEWRNLFVGDDGTPHYQPLAYLDAVHGFDEGIGANLGRLVDNSGRTDSTIRRREQVINFGEGIDVEEAKAIAAQYLIRDADPGWTAEVELSVDPEEHSRFEIIEGDILKVKHIAGTGSTGLLFHVATYEQNGWDTMRLTVDTKFRDAGVLEQILRRNRSGNSPTRSLRLGRTSGQTNDTTVPWDAGNGAGWLPRERAPRFNGGSEGTQTVALTANTWGIFQVPAGEAVNIGEAEFFCSTPAEFCVGVFDWAIDTGHLPTNPLTATTDWSNNVVGCLMAWGWQPQPCGYWNATGPILKSQGATKTGVMIADNVWPISHARGTPTGSGSTSLSGSPALVWIAVFCDTTCSCHARLSLD